MRIRQFSHKQLALFYEHGTTKGLPQDSRLTFKIEGDELLDVNLEDHH